ncbi:hypothetical protein [Streptomyces sp. NPDC007856]|uniref:hypothetical protein n=1 Tax=Streptomyces sp. NPDC007856 TaxID=3364781 RepID=UPI0036A73E13
MPPLRTGRSFYSTVETPGTTGKFLPPPGGLSGLYAAGQAAVVDVVRLLVGRLAERAADVPAPARGFRGL